MELATPQIARSKANRASWPTTRLQNLLVQPATYGIVKAGQFQQHGVLMLRSGEIKNGQIGRDLPYITQEKSDEYARTVLRSGDVVIALVGYPGETAVVPDWLVGGNVSRAVGLLRPGSSLDSAFLAAYLNSPLGRREFLKPAAGSAQIVVNLKDLNLLQIPQLPLNAQRAIAAALSDADRHVATLDTLIEKKRAVKEAVMQRLLTGRQRLPGFSEEWETVAFGSLTRPERRKMDPRVDGQSTPCIELEHIESGTRRLLGNTTLGEQGSLKTAFRPGDVLFGKLRSYLRKHWFASYAGACSTEIWVFRADGERLVSAYLYHLSTSDSFVAAASTTQGTHMPRSDWNAVREYPVPLPPADEQRAIATVLSDMDAEIAALIVRRDKARMVKRGMAQELLTGRTRLV